MPQPKSRNEVCILSNNFPSVRRLGDNGGHGPPQRIRLCLVSVSPTRGDGNTEICDNHGWRANEDDDGDSGQESDYENRPGGGRLRKMAGEVIAVLRKKKRALIIIQ